MLTYLQAYGGQWLFGVDECPVFLKSHTNSMIAGLVISSYDYIARDLPRIIDHVYINGKLVKLKKDSSGFTTRTGMACDRMNASPQRTPTSDP